MLRLHFLHHRRLLPRLCRCAWKSLTLFLHEYFERRDIFPGGILVPQTFGGMANWNPHVHALITDACWDRESNQYHMPEIGTSDLKVIEKLFAASVFGMFLEEDMISEELVEKMSSWKHSVSGISREPVVSSLLVSAFIAETQSRPRTKIPERLSANTSPGLRSHLREWSSMRTQIRFFTGVSIFIPALPGTSMFLIPSIGLHG